jgi:hypothetical protein
MTVVQHFEAGSTKVLLVGTSGYLNVLWYFARKDHVFSLVDHNSRVLNPLPFTTRFAAEAATRGR